MKDQKLKNSFLELIKIMGKGLELPGYIFSKKFDNHLFFDADITTSDQLLFGIKEVVLNSFGHLLPSAIFSSSTREILGVVEPEWDWPKFLLDLTESIRMQGNYGGYIIVDSELRWVAYQEDSVSLGVLAFDGKNPWNYLSRDARDCFVSVARMEKLFISESREDAEMINIFGREYFFSLIKNYA